MNLFPPSAEYALQVHYDGLLFKDQKNTCYMCHVSFKLYACSFTFNSPQLGYGTQAVCHGRVSEQKRYYHTVLHERLFELLDGCLI